jgi:hypothetical protein
VVPFALFENGRALSILNATSSTLLLGDHRIRAVQFGTVATDPQFRHRGLSRRLIQEVINQYRATADLFFLYANDSVLDFYPKLGFERVEETQFILPLKPQTGNRLRKLDPKVPADRKLIFNRFDRRIPLSGVCGIDDYRLLAKWYALTFFAENLWYRQDADVLLVASAEDSRILIQDVVTPNPVPGFFDDFAWPGSAEAALQFIPDQFRGNFVPTRAADGDTLFVHGRLPPGHPVKIPVLAHT